MLTKLLSTTVPNPPLPLSAMTPAERARGRGMRAPDGRDAGAADASSTQGDGDAATTGAGDDAGGGDDATVLGGTDDADAGTGDGTGEGGDSGEGGGDDGDQCAAAAQAGAPEKYELTAPDGFEQIDTEVLAEAEPTLKELNLSNEQAQKLMPIAGQLVKRTMERAEKAITDRAIQNRKEWNDAFEADAEIGGANKDKTIADAARAFDHYGLKKGEGLRQLLDESGLGNHPDMIRFVARVGRDLSEGSFERGDAASTKKTAEQSLYGPEFQAKG